MTRAEDERVASRARARLGLRAVCALAAVLLAGLTCGRIDYDPLPGALGDGGAGGAGAGGALAGLGGAGGAGGATGGAPGSGGATDMGGATGSGGALGSGGATDMGGATGSGGASAVGGAPGSGGAASTGGATGAGGGPAPCLQLLTASTDFDAAASGLTAVVEDFSRDALGVPVITFVTVLGNFFQHNADVTFESFATSDQATAGSRRSYVVAQGGNGATSSIGLFNGYDGVAPTFAAPQTAVGLSFRVPSGSDGFSLLVRRSDTTDVATFAVTSTGSASYAGIRSTCGAVIHSIDFGPNPVPGGSHQSIYWELASVRYAH
jgi:hypothetical protein